MRQNDGERDEETGLALHGARYYAAWLGRWTAADPIGLGDGVNRFAYCGGAPVRLTDRSGKASEGSLLEALLQQQNALREALQNGGGDVETDELSGLALEIRGELARMSVHEATERELSRLAAASDQARSTGVGDNRPSMAAGSPRDPIERASDPRDLQRAEYGQLIGLFFAPAANRATQVTSKWLEDLGVIAPVTDRDRRVRGAVAGEFGMLLFGAASGLARGLGALAPARMPTRLPRTGGRWEGKPGDGKWFSDKQEVLDVTGGAPVVFKGGRPNFSPWAKGSLEFDRGTLTGKSADFSLVHRKLAAELGLKNMAAAERWLRAKGLTAHHRSETVIELVPTKLHGSVPHTGSAADLRNMARRNEGVGRWIRY